MDNKQLTAHIAWHTVTQAAEKHKAGWRERAVPGAGTMAGPALEQRREGGKGESLLGEGGFSRGFSKCGSLKKKAAWHVNEATYAGSLAQNPGAQQMPALYFKTRRRNPTHVSFS